VKPATKLRVVDADAEVRALANRQARARAATDAELAEARAELEAEQRSAAEAEQRKIDTAEMNEAIALVASLPARLAPALRALRDLDRQAAPVVDRAADLIVEGQDAFARATELAERLECSHIVQRSISNPTLAWVSLLSRIAIARDREQGGRDIANGWVEAAIEPHPTSPARPAYDAAARIVEQMEKSE